eukprot:7714250-Alexandrium_andersonii.AAC.1
MLCDGAQKGGVRSTGSFKGRGLVRCDFDVTGESNHAAAVFHVLPDRIAASKVAGWEPLDGKGRW